MATAPHDRDRSLISADRHVIEPPAVWMQEIGARRFMWSSDFPHPHSMWPNSQQLVLEELGRLQRDVVDQLCWRTASKIFRIAVSEPDAP